MNDDVQELLQLNLRAIVRRKFKLRSAAADEVAADLLEQVSNDIKAHDIRLNQGLTKEIPFKQIIPRWHDELTADDELVEVFSKSADISLVKARMCLVILISEIEKKLARGESFRLHYFGTFAAIAQETSTVNTNGVGTGQAYRRPFKYRLIPSQQLRNALN